MENTITKQKEEAVEKTDNKTKIRFKESVQYFNTIKENVGDYTLLGDPSKETYVDVDVQSHISEIDFYRCFLYLKSGLAKVAYQNEKVDRTLTPVNIEYMAYIMAKPMEYTMPAKSKNKIQQKLAADLNRTHKSAYSAINRLKSSGYLVETEDNLIMPNQELQKLRRVTKDHLEKLGCFPVCYMLNFIVK